MPKHLIAIPKGNLMSIAASKSVTSLAALKEKTGVDRKTLRLINSGQPVKEMTLQTIANRLRVPLPHLLGPTTPDNTVAGDGSREINLQRLDVAALRRIAGETDELNWFLKVDQVSEELETLLVKLRNSLRGWFAHEVGMTTNPEATDNLAEQIDYIKTSVDIDETFEALSERKLKMFGATYVAWRKETWRDPNDDYHPVRPILCYRSRVAAALAVVPEQKAIPAVRVYPGSEPPQTIDPDTVPSDLDFVEVDGVTVWSRTKIEEPHKDDHNDGIPF
jgi:hypothetical protein